MCTERIQLMIQCKWFRNFRDNNFNLTDTPRFGRLAKADGNKILELIESDR